MFRGSQEQEDSPSTVVRGGGGREGGSGPLGKPDLSTPSPRTSLFRPVLLLTRSSFTPHPRHSPLPYLLSLTAPRCKESLGGGSLKYEVVLEYFSFYTKVYVIEWVLFTTFEGRVISDPLST